MITEKDYWEGNMTPEEFEENLPKYGYEYTPITNREKGEPIPEQVEYANKVKEKVGEEPPMDNHQVYGGMGRLSEELSTEKSFIVGGAQIPVGVDIQINKKEIFKAIDWAKDNGVEHLLTPEGSLSGWLGGWEQKLDELTDALREVEEHQKKAGVALHLGTNFYENEYFGTQVFRNEIRHYKSNGRLSCCTYKTMCLDKQASFPSPPLEHVLRRHQDDSIVIVRLDHEDEPVATADLWTKPLAAGLICNDMWGYQAGGQRPVTSIMNEMGCFNLIFHATNGRKSIDTEDRDWEVFDKWHDAFYHMTAHNMGVPILAVDACTDWAWDGDEAAVDECTTSSQSGVINHNGWQVTVPRKGRHYFKWELKIPKLEELTTIGGESE